MLTSLNLPAIMDTSADDLIQDLFVPALRESRNYDRGVGFFSSGWLRIAAEGMAALARNGGTARWITSPILSKADWEALQQGEAAHYSVVLKHALERNLNDLEHDLEQDTLSALAWMIADNILEFRLAVPTGKLDGDFHDKFGVFTDAAGNRVSFNGSYNESIQGTRNYESVKIFCSWNPPFATLVEEDVRRFERLWTNTDPNVRVVSLPQAAKEKLLKLRKYGRPYSIGEGKIEEAALGRPWHRVDRKLRDYQEEAIKAWFDNNCRGIVEMATGTGKTITALSASVQLYEREERLAVVIAAPFQHLVDQWRDEAAGFGYKPILAYASRKSWVDELNRQVIEYSNQDRNFMSVITTHATFISDAFQQSIARLRGPVLLIADEVHHLGAERSREELPEHVRYRLGLSATPDRWFDDAGTALLRAYFGKTVYSLPLEKAIGISLTPYYYHPHLVSLAEWELEEYRTLSARIGALWNNKEKEAQEMLKMLLIKRAKLLNNAQDKLTQLSKLVDENLDMHHTLFYCTPEQKQVVLFLLGQEKGLLVHTFTAHEDMKERRRLIEQFAKGHLQGLVAIKCLDEGVDVPATETAYILASSSNPREFIQRRGRILRKYPGKEVAVIHDLIAMPPVVGRSKEGDPVYVAERSIIKRELERFKEFAGAAINKHQAIEVIWPLAKHYGLIDL